MINLLRREWLIIRNYRVAWFFLISFLGTLFVTQAVLRHTVLNFNQVASSADALNIAALISWILSWGSLFSFLFAVQMQAVEFENHTLQQAIRMGTPRWQWVTSKMLLSGAGSFLVAICIIAVVATFPSSSSSWSDVIIGGIAVGLKYWGYAAMGFLTGLMIKKPLPAAMAFSLYASIGEPLFGWGIQQFSGIDISTYLPAQLLSQVVPSPFAQEPTSYPHLTMGLSPVYILLIYGASILLLKNREIKP